MADSYNNVVRMVDSANGLVRTIAGTGERGYSGDGGPAGAALFDSISGLAVDQRGNLFISDIGACVIREVRKEDGKVRRVAGTGRAGQPGDGGPALSASLQFPGAISIDEQGFLYVTEVGPPRSMRARVRSTS